MELTPGGPRAKSSIHFVEPGCTITAVTSSVEKRYNLGAVVPLGTYRMPPYSVDDAVYDTTEADEPDTPAAYEPGRRRRNKFEGWITFANWLNESDSHITSFRATWRVPPAPEVQANQVIYLFNGLRDASSSGQILQPVLQWNAVPDDPNASGWSISSWLALGADSSGPTCRSGSVSVAEEDILTGVISLEEVLDDGVQYRCEFLGFPDTVLEVKTPFLPYVVVSLEAWNAVACEKYPAAEFVRFIDLDVKIGEQHPEITWAPRNVVGNCGQQTIVQESANPGGVIDLIF